MRRRATHTQTLQRTVLSSRTQHPHRTTTTPASICVGQYQLANIACPQLSRLTPIMLSSYPIFQSNRFVFFYKFEDFGQARNAVLRSTTHHFPDASHILFADADWRPDLATVDLSEVDLIHASFQFLLWDHSGHTTRLAGWLLRNDSRLRFKYRCNTYASQMQR